jgi:hypothetical protein
MLQVRSGQGCEQRRQQAPHLAKVLQNLSVNRSNATSHHTGCTCRERVTMPQIGWSLVMWSGRAGDEVPAGVSVVVFQDGAQLRDGCPVELAGPVAPAGACVIEAVAAVPAGRVQGAEVPGGVG